MEVDTAKEKQAAEEHHNKSETAEKEKANACTKRDEASKAAVEAQKTAEEAEKVPPPFNPPICAPPGV